MFNRYAIYFTATGAFAARGAAWLGWDIGSGSEVAHPVIKGLDVATVTERPRKYGFHGTIKAPFVLAKGCDEAGLRAAVIALCQQTKAVEVAQLELATLGRFLALVPIGAVADLNDLGAKVVADLDPFRAPASEDELARRRKGNLSPAQEAHLNKWGYPHVMDQFRFHMTLTGRLPRGEVDRVAPLVAAHFHDVLAAPLRIDALTLAGERHDGRWQAVERVPLT